MPSTSWNDDVIDKVQTSVTRDRHIAIRELADAVSTSVDSVHSNMTENLTVQRVCAKLREIGSFVAVTPLPVLRIQYATFWPNTARFWFVELPIPLDTSSRDFRLLPKLKMSLNGTRFHTWEDLIENPTRRPIARSQNSLMKCVSNGGGDVGKSVYDLPRTILWRSLNFRPSSVQ